MNLKIGQEVFVVGIGNNARYEIPTLKATVTKIGRKWFNIDTGNNVGEHNKFCLEDGKSDGRGYMPEWRVYLSEKEYNESKRIPHMRNYISSNLKSLSYQELLKIEQLILKIKS